MNKYIGQIIIEVTSPLAIGSGKSSFDNDTMVAKDFNFLPYIPGTGLAGIISSFFEEKFGIDEKEKIFGGEDDEYKRNVKETLKGSDFEISDALLLDSDSKVLQLPVPKNQLSDFHKKFLLLPKREHVRIDYRGVSEDHGKFDNEFVFKGARFKFEIELMAEDDKYWKFILNSFFSKDFLLGSGTTNNYGQIKVISLKTKTYDLSDKEGLTTYLKHTADLNVEFKGEDVSKEPSKGKWQYAYSLDLSANAIHIGAGYGDIEVDDTNYNEYVIEWDKDNVPKWKKCFVIPGSSIKGAVAHRLAYYQNSKENKYVETIVDNYRKEVMSIKKEEVDKIFNAFESEIAKLYDSTISLEDKKKKLNDYKQYIINYDYKVDINTQNIFEKITGENNEAVKEMFGDASHEGKSTGSIGKVIFDDCFIPEEKVTETIFDHNSIDRYTGATINTALFSEKVFTPNIPVFVTVRIFNIDETDTGLLNKTIYDILHGDLAFGGKSNKGYGFFKGKLIEL